MLTHYNMQNELVEIKSRLEANLLAFEKQYAMSSTDFYERFENGELGDAMDFIEWAATIEMLDNLNKRIGDFKTDVMEKN